MCHIEITTIVSDNVDFVSFDCGYCLNVSL